jgi:CD36 family
MTKKELICIGSLCCLGTVFIVLGSLTPLIITTVLEDTIQSKAYLTQSNNPDLWGTLPGKSNSIVFQHFHFYNVENPDDVLWKGSAPILTEQNGYIYQEFDTFEDLEYDDDYIYFFNYRRVAITSNTLWNTASPNDNVTTLNIGSFAIWSQAKSLPRASVALLTAYQLALAFNTEVALLGYIAGISAFLVNYDIAQYTVFTPAGIDATQGYYIWYDSFYGMGSPSTLITWVEALEQNTVNSSFVMPQVLTGPLYTLQNYFGLSLDQLEKLMSGHILNSYNLLVLILYNDQNYNCTPYNGMEMCDPEYLGALQWSQSLLTLSPPVISPIGPSITSLTSALTGYPEMNYYLNGTTIGSKYPSVNFTVSDYFKIFNYNRTTGYPIYESTNLLDVGRMNTFFALGSAGNFSTITNLLNLTDEDHARVLWDYMNAIVDYTALQGRTDPSVYNLNGRGITSELSLGTLGSTSLQQIFDTLTNSLLMTVTAIYGYLTIYNQLGLTCESIVPSNYSYLCSYEGLIWETDTSGYQNWLGVYWYGVNSSYGSNFMTLSGLSYNELVALFSDNNTLTQNFGMFDSDLMTFYNCQNAGKRCSSQMLAAKQWGQSYVSLNLPGIFSQINIQNSTTLFNIPWLGLGFNIPVEYSNYAYQRNSGPLLLNQTLFLLSSSGLLTSSIFQQYFIYLYELNYTAITQQFKIQDADLMGNYLRYIINGYYFNGMICTKTVDEILFTGVDPILALQQQANPLLGGNPSIDPAGIRLAQNQTREQWEYVPVSYKSVMHNGKQDIKQVRGYEKYLGADYANVLVKEYVGQGPEGPIIEWVNLNPWAEEADLSGIGDGWFFYPNLQKSDGLSFYLDTAAYIVNVQYQKSVTNSGFDCYRYAMFPSFLYNATQDPAVAKFYQFAPQGLINQTSVLQMPLFLSKPYFLDADPVLTQLVSYTNPQYNVPANYDSYFDSEYHSGIPMYLANQIQFNAELKSDALFPLLGLDNLNKFGYKTYMPVLFDQRTSLISQHCIDEYLQPIKTALLLEQIGLIVGTTLGSLMFVVIGLYYLKKRIVARRELRNPRKSPDKKQQLLA